MNGFEANGCGALLMTRSATLIAANGAARRLRLLVGAPRVSTAISAGTRTDKAQGLDDRVKSVEDKLGA